MNIVHPRYIPRAKHLDNLIPGPDESFKTKGKPVNKLFFSTIFRPSSDIEIRNTSIARGYIGLSL
jgi:hypothetical protein